MADRRDAVSLEEALALAIQWHQAGKLDQAETLYERILQASPALPEALHFFGMLHYQRGHIEQALQLIAQALEHAPDYADAYNNLGNIHKEQNHLPQAAEAYSKVLALRAEHTDALSNLAMVLRAQGEPAQALTLLQKAVALEPKHANALYNLGNILGEMGRYEEALLAYRKNIALDIQKLDAFQRLAYTLYRLGRYEEATSVIEEWLRKDPGNPVATHMLAANSGKNVPARASDAYVQTHFDEFAEGFDDKLASLQYKVPARLAEILAEIYPETAKALRILDAGCGTGLCAPPLRPYADFLHGVDLSPKMLHKAQALQLYDELTTAELSNFLAKRPAPYDLMVAADTLVYFGDLQPLCHAVATILQDGGRWIFNAEDTGPEKTDFYLAPHGRYCHSKDYLQACLRKAGLQVQRLDPESLRMEGGQPVLGWIVVAEKPFPGTKK